MMFILSGAVPAFTWSFAENHQTHSWHYCEMKLWTLWHYELKTVFALDKHALTHKLGIQRVSLCQHSSWQAFKVIAA